MELIAVTFTQWAKWNPRKDIKHPTWFAMSNRITEDDKILTLSDREFRAFIHIFCLASQDNNPTASVNLAKAERVTGMKAEHFLATIRKLVSLGVCEQPDGSRTDHDGNPTDGVRIASATLQDKTLQDTTVQHPPSAGLTPQGLLKLWDENRGPFPAVEVFTDDRKKKAAAQIRKSPDAGHWLAVIQRWQKSDFCLSQWRPGFDELLSLSKRTSTLEGKYDNRAPRTASGVVRAPIRAAPTQSVKMDLICEIPPDARDESPPIDRDASLARIREQLAKAGNLGFRKEGA